MSASRARMEAWRALLVRVLPFADAATTELPLSRLLRLSSFQISVGIALVLLNGTLNRVMIVELGIPAWLVSSMVALPILFAPVRALIGFRSDNHRSVLGWRRVPYIWMGTLLQFCGLAILPFSLLVLSGRRTYAPPLVGEAAAALAFLLVGAGVHTSQTAGVALATDLAPEGSRPRVVALLYVMLLVGMVVASLCFGVLLRPFEYVRLIQVIQGAALATMALNLVALWRQEPRRPYQAAEQAASKAEFGATLRDFLRGGPAPRLLVAVGLGGAGFNIQDILLEPYGGELLGLPVSQTTMLTALMAGATPLGVVVAARRRGRGYNTNKLGPLGGLLRIAGFSTIVFAAPLGSLSLFLAGTAGIGFGGGWFAVGTLTSAMALSDEGDSGMAVGAWGAVQATTAGVAIAIGGGLPDVLSNLPTRGVLGPGLRDASVGYLFVYHIEIALLFGMLIALGPLVRSEERFKSSTGFGLAELPN